LWLEKIFRKLYDAVIKKEVKPMEMDVSDFKSKVNLWLIAFRPTIWPIYLTEIILLSVCILYFAFL